MKKLVVNFLCCMIFIFISGKMNAQNQSTATIKKLRLVTMDQKDASKKSYALLLDISEQKAGKKLYILLGSKAFSGDISTSEASFVQGTKTQISYNNKSYKTCQNSVMIPLELTNANVEKLKFITAYVEDVNGKITNKLVYKFPKRTIK